jgi:hypothetical protein
MRIPKTQKIAAAVVAALFSLIVVGLVVFLIFSGGGDKDHRLRTVISPDGKARAELHEVITPMHGGRDSVYVSLGDLDSAFDGRIFVKYHECNDLSAFQLSWEDSDNLTVSYGGCDTGRWKTAGDDKIWVKNTAWRGINIKYLDTGKIATQ